jgi:hypothetical protein
MPDWQAIRLRENTELPAEDVLGNVEQGRPSGSHFSH